MNLSIVARVKSLGLPLEQCIVAGSGVLDALGIRRADDVDLVVTKSLYEVLKLNDSEWTEEPQHDRHRLVDQSGLVEVWYSWASQHGVLSYDELQPSSIVLDGIRFTSLDFVFEWKRWMDRPKDQNDVRLIEAYKEVVHDS